MDFDKELNTQNANIKMLLDSIRISKRRLVIFAGAGVSALFGLPLWNNFSRMLLDACYSDGYISYHDKENFLSSVGSDSKMLITLVYNIYEEKKELNKFYEHFKTFLKSSNNKNEEDIISAFKQMKACIITTNADLSLDQCVYSEENDIYYKNSFFDNNSEINFGVNNPIVIHIHGSVRDEESLVFTMKKYLERYERGKETFDNIMRRLLNNPDNTILFIGSSMTEMELLQYIIKGDGKISNRFILNGFYENQSLMANVMENYYMDCFGIRQISYSMDDYGYNNIVNFIKQLANEISLSTEVTIDIFNDAIKCLNTGNINKIVDNINYCSTAMSLPLLAELFAHINNMKNASAIHVRLYEKYPKLFSIDKYSDEKNTVQNVIMTSLTSCSNVSDIKKFNAFINKYIKNIEQEIDKDKLDLSKSFKILWCYVRYINMNLNYNASKLEKLIDKLIKKEVDYFPTFIYEVSKYNLSKNSAYKIVSAIFNPKYLKESKKDYYEINKFIQVNFPKILGKNAVGFFRIIRNYLFSLLKKNKYAFYDLGAIYDYFNESEYISYEKYILKLLKQIIDSMLPNDVCRAYDVCNSKDKIDIKIKLYMIDKRFDLLNDRINVDLINNIDAVASFCWVIKNNKMIIKQDNELYKRLKSIVNECTFPNESDVNANGLKRTINSFLDDKDIKVNEPCDSDYESYEFYNIGKHFWSSPINENVPLIYSQIKDLGVDKLISYINENGNLFLLDLDGALSLYFKSETNEISIIKNPELFKTIIREDYYRSILCVVRQKNNIDKLLIKDFLTNVVKEKCNNNNAMIWLDILESNNLVDDSEFSIKVLDIIFDCLLEQTDDLIKINNEFVFNSINNGLYRCFCLMCDAHISNGDVMQFIQKEVDKDMSISKKCLLLSSISAKYSSIVEKDEGINDLLFSYINNSDDTFAISIYNNLIFSNLIGSKKLISIEKFRTVFNKLDKQSQDYYSHVILLFYNDFDLELVNFIAENTNVNDSSQIIERFVNGKYRGKIDNLLDLIEELTSNNEIKLNISKELLELLSINLQNIKLRNICSKIAKMNSHYLDWKKLENQLTHIMELDEDYLVKDIFEPLSMRYIDDNKFYIENEYHEVFNQLWTKIKEQSNYDVMKKIALYAFQSGITQFKNYVK